MCHESHWTRTTGPLDSGLEALITPAGVCNPTPYAHPTSISYHSALKREKTMQHLTCIAKIADHPERLTDEYSWRSIAPFRESTDYSCPRARRSPKRRVR